MVNGQYVEGLGLGISRNLFNADVLDEFLGSLDVPLELDQRILWPDNKAFFSIVTQGVESNRHQDLCGDIS